MKTVSPELDGLLKIGAACRSLPYSGMVIHLVPAMKDLSFDSLSDWLGAYAEVLRKHAAEDERRENELRAANEKIKVLKELIQEAK